MLSPAAFRLLSDRTLINKHALRLFLHLVADYDLTRFRALNMQVLTADYKMAPIEVSKGIAVLVRAKIIEAGPEGTLAGLRGQFIATYRIRPAYLLSPESLRAFFQETREREERETLAPKIPEREFPPLVV